LPFIIYLMSVRFHTLSFIIFALLIFYSPFFFLFFFRFILPPTVALVLDITTIKVSRLEIALYLKSTEQTRTTEAEIGLSDMGL
jgi:hypothetical protein